MSDTSESGTDREPFRRIQAVSSVQNDVREMQQNLRELQSELRQLEWGLLGGRSMYDPAKTHKLCTVTAENLEYIADEIDQLPRSVEEAENHGGEEDE